MEDTEKVVEILNNRLTNTQNQKASAKKGEHFVLVGHGTYTPSTAIYSQMDYMLKANGLSNFHVGTIEGYPSFETMLAQLKAGKAKQVTLVPFMFVAGDHAVNVRMEGLGQVPEIQEIFINHIRFMLKHRILDIMEKKAGYAAGKDVE